MPKGEEKVQQRSTNIRNKSIIAAEPLSVRKNQKIGVREGGGENANARPEGGWHGRGVAGWVGRGMGGMGFIGRHALNGVGPQRCSIAGPAFQFEFGGLLGISESAAFLYALNCQNRPSKH